VQEAVELKLTSVQEVREVMQVASPTSLLVPHSIYMWDKKVFKVQLPRHITVAVLEM
jgi:hypothetical protein